MRGYARQRDANEKSIVEALKSAGATVTPLNGAGVPDLLVGFNAKTFLLEVKRPITSTGKTTGGATRPSNGGDGVLTEAQIRWWKAWTGAPPVVVTTPEEALRAIGAIT